MSEHAGIWLLPPTPAPTPTPTPTPTSTTKLILLPSNSFSHLLRSAQFRHERNQRLGSVRIRLHGHPLVDHANHRQRHGRHNCDSQRNRICPVSPVPVQVRLHRGCRGNHFGFDDCHLRFAPEPERQWQYSEVSLNSISARLDEDEHTCDESRKIATDMKATSTTKLTHLIHFAPSSLGAAFRLRLASTGGSTTRVAATCNLCTRREWLCRRFCQSWAQSQEQPL